MMDNAAKIKAFRKTIPMIYAYSHPGYPPHDGWTKIGYTEKQTVEERVKQQNHTSGIAYKILWRDNAMYKDGSGEYFTDHDFHSYLTKHRHIERMEGHEWFRIDGKTSQMHFIDFANREIPKSDSGEEYILREEQEKAVKDTKAYFENGGTEFLWNAKPRFGKTLTTYDLIHRMGFHNVLIVTNRPSISNSWADDFFKFIGWRGELCFVSETDALSEHEGVISRSDYLHIQDKALDRDEDPPGMIAFESLQGLKGSIYFGGEYDKLEWMAKEYKTNTGEKKHGVTFDLLVIDESQEGVDTFRTEKAFENINRNHTLYLSGTPFKQLAGGKFAKEQIFNWSYADEQAKKEYWPEDADYNPYEALPKLSMFTYRLSDMITEVIKKGADISEDGGKSDFAFDLNEFFITGDNGKFVHENEIKKFLHSLYTQEKYPFSTPELRKELAHTMWYLNRVASAKALAALLKNDPVFCEYEVVIAAGDGKTEGFDDNDNSKAIERVRKAIAEHDKTITLTVGQLTVGVTIPQWSGVLMLCNMQSPSSYMQAAFRAQNPYTFTDPKGNHYRKETAYVFDFDPARTLIIFDEFANNLSPETAAGKGTAEDREKNIRTLLNFFPVLGEDDEGTMVELDAKSVLSIPRRLKCSEVVRKGFMCNFLFQNIGNIFSAPAAVRQILEKLPIAQEEKNKKDKIGNIENIDVNSDGEVEIPNERVIGTAATLFGEKIYEKAEETVAPLVYNLSENKNTAAFNKSLDEISATLQSMTKENMVASVAAEYNIKSSAKKKIETQAVGEIQKEFDKIKFDLNQQERIATNEYKKQLEQAQGDKEKIKVADDDYRINLDKILQAATVATKEAVDKTVKEKPKDIILQLEKYEAEAEKKSVEDSVRDHLRGFARTIPSFIMAYGDENLTLANFDDYTEDDVFYEVTGITEEQFRFLRDGGDYFDEETGEAKHFIGQLFDEVVFNDSIKEFLSVKNRLSNYFDESNEEDIFDYIPPQKTNQIFTPRWVVKKMVNQLEENNPGCFDDPNKTFADLYMKSGLYITEIVKRLFNSQGLTAAFPHPDERIRHILSRQVYGMAPTRIIYLIATNYILGFDEKLKAENHNFVQADAAEAAKSGKLEKLVDEHFT